MSLSSFEETRPDQIMETLHFACRCCSMQLTVPVQLAGVSGPCPGCGETIVAPQPLSALGASGFAEMAAAAAVAHETLVPASSITALPCASVSKPRSHLSVALHSTSVRFAAYLALLAAVVTYFGIPKSGTPRPQSVVAQLQPAPVPEQRTVVSTTTKEAYPESSINMEPRFSAASRPLPATATTARGQ